MLIFGAGGHGRVIREALVSKNIKPLLFFDDNPALKEFCGLEVAPYSVEVHSESKIIIAIGDNQTRRAVTSRVQHQLGTLVDSDASCPPSLQLGQGSVILKSANIQSEVIIGESVIINTGAIVEHDCRIGHFVHIAPGSIICGEVKIGDNTLIGAGAIVLPGIKIGDNCVIGAGTVVNKHVKDQSKVVGNPMRIINW